MHMKNPVQTVSGCIRYYESCFIQKIYAPSSSLLQGKHLPFSPSPLSLNIFRLFVILSLTQLYRFTPVSRKVLINIYLSIIRPVLEYADIVWDNCTLNQMY
jgi:hypothetical protein